MKKYIIILITIGLLFFLVVLVNKNKAEVSINSYMDQQGITENEILIKEFQKDWKLGGYNLLVSVKDEPDSYYEYHYEKGTVTVQAYKELQKDIQQKYWGGSGLSNAEMQKLKYPPLNEFNQ
ncbi:DUF3139 domain-containing protein [Carnobacterium gallinarum]|uniref:DUF3139 domain-containing protein n=1 Tax=Carnobacterium gallinarum TaxID=2749 RepID=UPI000550A93B|nr:DUF3139 domain-containing protein [Carnobacterium gallinarum]